MDIPTSELFAPAGPGRTFESFVDASGRAEAIWFPFTDKPWLKVWTVSPSKPAASRAVSAPYNYPFSDTIPQPVARMADLLVTATRAPPVRRLEYEIAKAGLAATRSLDLWGQSKDVQLYIKSSTLRVDEWGYAVLALAPTCSGCCTARRREVHRAAADLPRRGQLPDERPGRVGWDASAGSATAGASPPLSAPRRAPDRPEWDTVVWINLLTFAGTRDSLAFYRDFERWVLATFDGTRATLRPEWAKGWAFTATQPPPTRSRLVRHPGARRRRPFRRRGLRVGPTAASTHTTPTVSSATASSSAGARTNLPA